MRPTWNEDNRTPYYEETPQSLVLPLIVALLVVACILRALYMGLL